MVEPGQYSDTLRALGAFIERTGAVSVEIVDRGDNWLVAATLGSETLFSTFMLDDLRTEAHRRRGDGRADGELCDALRTIGHQLDVARAQSFTLRQVTEGFLITASSESGDSSWTYSPEQLEAMALEMRQARQSEPTSP
jgi:hypothetical protein